MNRLIFALLLSLCFVGCKSKKEKKKDVAAADFFPVKDYINGQVAKLGTANYSFLKIETVDSHSDTTAIKNSDIRQYAKDFLELPDISSKEIKDDYEINHLYDEELEAFAFTFTTKEDHPVKSEHVVVEPTPNAEGKNDIKSIFVDMWQNQENTTIRKNLFWEANKSFQITTTTEPQAGNPSTKRVRIVWNGFASQRNTEDTLK
ncbi:MAG: hypothetical protein EOO10_12730 [Chitinophagaceae bacterium]|nr:MAG: hypothetical protein EOO10_12730 [Chitinophagaceae bacterium]